MEIPYLCHDNRDALSTLDYTKMKNKMPNELPVDTDFFSITDDLFEDEVIYEIGVREEEAPPEEVYKPEDFIWASYYGVKPLTAGSSDSDNNNPWINAGVIVVSIVYCVSLFFLFLK